MLIDGSPYGITGGPDGALWFTLLHQGRIGRVVPGEEPTLFPLEPADGQPTVIAAGPDGALWLTEWGTDRLARVTTDGKIQEFPLEGAEPHGLAVGPDGAIWVAMESGALTRHSV